ncbi:hypothetical protein AAG906_020490 [Vitis piasezkii]
MHWTSQNGWINQEARLLMKKMLELQKQLVPEGGQALKEAEICVQGLSHGPRPPPSSSRSICAKSHREMELETELRSTQELIQSQEARIYFVSEMRQHMHIPGSSSRSSSPSDDTPLMGS